MIVGRYYRLRSTYKSSRPCPVYRNRDRVDYLEQPLDKTMVMKLTWCAGFKVGEFYLPRLDCYAVFAEFQVEQISAIEQLVLETKLCK